MRLGWSAPIVLEKAMSEPARGQSIWRWIWSWSRPWTLAAHADNPSLSVSDQFSLDAAAASALLDFLVKEGLQPIRDQIIDDIEAAREVAASGIPPSKEDCARLRKARRDLALVPRITLIAARVPPATFWSPDSPWPGLLIFASLVPTILGLVAWWLCFCDTSPAAWRWSIAYFFLSILSITGLYVFSGTVTNNKLNQIIRFCYFFTGIALLGSLLPFAIPDPFSNAGMASKAPLGILQGCVKPDADKVGKDPSEVAKNYPKEVLCDFGGGQWVVNLGGIVTGPGVINGGLVVPLYVVFLALFGGAISMTRRVPEYQRRAMDSHDVLTNAEARESLVFQIMQVFTAPLIAVTVYYIILPDTPLKSVVLGFGSGFASEPILLMIRALVDKLRPTPEASPAVTGGVVSVTMTPPSATVPPGTAMQFAASISGAPNTQVLWALDPPDASAGIISQNGFYVAPASPPTKGVTITARSATDSTKFATASVKIEPIVIVTPASDVLGPKNKRQFSAAVLGLSGPGVDWSIDPKEGQISTGGEYTAPDPIAAAGIVTIIARSNVDATRFGSAKVTLKPVAAPNP